MKIRRRQAELRAARMRVVMARERLSASSRAIEAQVRARPLVCAGLAVGGGWVLGRSGVRIWRVHAVMRLVYMHMWPWAMRLLALARSPA